MIKDNYLYNAELSTEQNCNMIDHPKQYGPAGCPVCSCPGGKPAGQGKGPPAQAEPGTGTVSAHIRKRDIHMHVIVTVDEFDTIHQRTAEAKITNAGAYIRKMALNGYVLNVDLAPVRELVSLQRRCANNLNQVAIHANTYGVYPSEIAALQKDYAELWGRISDVLKQLAKIIVSFKQKGAGE